MAITWNDSYSVNISDIDFQHKRLVEMVNQLESAMSSGKGKDVLGVLLKNLVRYTETHFTHEERLMSSHGFSGYAAHKTEHAALTQKAVDLQTQFLAGRMGLTIPIMNFLSDWLVNHIQGTDKKYSEYLNGQGVR